ncbi:MAG: immunoglobulin-like domain-containing protein, partial [bacterium]
FYALRQPMYLTGTTTGTISNNNTYGTKGWVLEGGNVTFTGNTWGTGAQANVYDIAILGTCPAIYHTDIVAIANANNDAVIEDQRVSPAVLSVVYVDNSTSYTTDLGGRFHPYPAIAPSLTRVVAGGKIFVTAGTYSEYLTVSKSCKMFGSNAGRHPAVGTHPTETVNPRYPETILNNLVPAADNIQIDGFKFLKAGTRIIDTYANANNFVLKNCIVESTIYGTTTGIIQFGGGSHTGCVFEFNLFKDKGDHTFYAGGGPYDNLVFQYNKFQSNNDAIFWASTPLIGGVIDHNEFDGENGANYNNINIGQAGNIQITNNWFHGILYTAIQCGILNGSISGNKFETHYGLAGYNAAAIQLWGGEYGTAVSSNVAITNNEIHYNQNGVSPVFGIRLRGPNSPSEPKIDGSTIHVHNNAFYNGGVRADAYAILFQGDLTTTVDATCNWWASEGTPLVYQAPTFTGPVTYIPYSVSNGGACVGGLATVTVQAPAQLSSCGNFDVNLTAKNFTNVGAISLYLNFNPLVFEYLPAGVTLNAKISSAVVTTTIQGKFILSWTSGNLGVNFDPDEVLCTLHFKLLPSAAGSSPGFVWSTTEGANEIAGPGYPPPVYNSFFDVFDPSWTTPARPVKNTNTGLEYCTIQDAINAASTTATQTLLALPGNYTENVIVDKSVIIHGANYGVLCANGRENESVINGTASAAVTIASDGVTIDGFTIKNPLGMFGIYAKGRNNTDIQYNIITDVGNNVTGTGAAYGVAIEMGSAANISNVSIVYNCVNNIRGGENTSLPGLEAKANNGSGVGIGAGFSNAAFDVSGLTISYNTIDHITACKNAWLEGGKGAYGVHINVGAGAAIGMAIDPVVHCNDISYLDGFWAHGIGLEGETPGAAVTNNNIRNLFDYKVLPDAPDAVGVMVEDNAGAGSVVITDNSFTVMDFGVFNKTGVLVNAEGNWWGTTGPIPPLVYGLVDWKPFLNGGGSSSSAPCFTPTGTDIECVTMSLGETHVDVACFDGSTGSIDLSVTGGVTSLSYAWTASEGGVLPVGQEIVQDPSGLKAGKYSVVVTDGNLCTQSITDITLVVTDAQAPNITTCPPAYTIAGCATTVITGPVYKADLTVVDASVFTAAGGVATDNCAVTYYAYKDVSSGTCPITVTRTWTVTDGVGNVTTCNQIITINHNTPPVVPGPGSGTVACVTDAVPGIESVDQQQLIFGNWYDENTIASGQSFTPAISGKLIKIDLQLYHYEAVPSFTLKVFAGDGITGTQLYTKSGYTLPGGGSGWVTLTLDATMLPTLTAGTKYTFWLTGYATNTIQLALSDASNPYAGGGVLWDITPPPPTPVSYPNFDCVFKTYMSAVPVVTDQCGTNITPVLASTVDNPSPLTCAGTRTYTYTYTDCQGLSSNWVYTCTVVHTTAPVVPASPAAVTVECESSATPPAAPTGVVDVCGTAITPSGPVVGGSGSLYVNGFIEPVVTGPTAIPGIWYTDRYAPYAFETAIFNGDSRLKHSINAVNYQGFPSFYATQGRGYELMANTSSMEIKLYVPAEWQNTNKRMGGFWGVAVDKNGLVSGYPIVEFASDLTGPRFQAYDNGVWVNMGLPAGFSYGSWVTLKVEMMPTGEFKLSAGNLSYTTVGLAPAKSVRIKSLILQGHNYDPSGTQGVTYDIYWDDLAYQVCEGTKTYTYTYKDCAGLSTDWVYTYTIDHVTPPIVPVAGSSTVECAAAAVVPGAPTTVTDVCGAPLTGVLTSTVDNPVPLVCNGTRTYTYTYTDCAGLSSTWDYVYTIDDNTAPEWTAPIFRRDMPLANVNNAAGANRSNVTWADGALSTEYYGDDFKLGPSPDGFWTINKVVVWGTAGDVTDPNFDLLDYFNGISLYAANAPKDPWTSPYSYSNVQGTVAMKTISTGSFGAGNTVTTTDGTVITAVEVTYYNGQSYQGSSGSFRRIWKVTFDNLNWTVPAGQLITYGVNCDHKYTGSTPEDVAKRWYNHFSNYETSLGSTPPWSAWNGLFLDYAPNGSNRDIYAIDAVPPGYWDKGSDNNVLIYGVASCALAINGCLGAAPEGPSPEAIAALFTDNCGGTVTATKSRVETGNNCNWDVKYVYEVKDACGNIKVPSPTLNYHGGDATIPVITLTGSSSVEICQNSTYTDNGATASDNCSGNITANIVCVNPINVAVPATYTVTYNVKDGCDNNAVQVTRTVTVTPTPAVTNGDMQYKTTGSWSPMTKIAPLSYAMCLDPATAWYYLDILNLNVAPDIASGFLNEFKLNLTGKSPAWLTTWFNYWAAKGVTSVTDPTLWAIVNGTAPIFYIYKTG